MIGYPKADVVDAPDDRVRLRRTTMVQNKPGQRADRSGLYDLVGPRGGSTGQQRTVTKDEPFPPTQKSGQGYVLAEPAKNGAGRGTR